MPPDSHSVPRLNITNESIACHECGMVLGGQAEFHPYTFCVLKKAGRDPWQEFRGLVRLYYGASSEAFEALPERPPAIVQTPRNRAVSGRA